jgi:hypothetical protein
MAKKYTGTVQDYILARVVVTEAGCWEWQRALNPTGYGMLGRGICGQATAHRASYQTFVGPIPEGLAVCHRCDNRKCCNPVHLFVATQVENIMDMVAKDRHSKGKNAGHPNMPKGEQMGLAKLTDELVRSFRRRARAGEPYRVMAREAGVDHAVISLAVRGKTWKHVDEPPVPTKERQFVPDDIVAIRLAYTQGESQNSIARRYKTDQSLISAICTRKIYTGVA